MAFDSTFIEIRHVDDGALVQVIRGNNLRLLFADTQPSIMNSSLSSASSIRSATSMHSSPTMHSYASLPQSFGYSHPHYPGYNGAPGPYNGQYNQFGAVYGHAPYMAAYAQPQRLRRAHERDEIILVSDDKVMAVRPAAPPPQHGSEATLVAS